MNKKYLLALAPILLTACQAGSTGGSDPAPGTCTASAPMFTQALGESLVLAWGANATKYSPYGDGGYPDVYVGAAYFTGVQYESNAVLLPTVSPVTRSTPQEIYNYFTHFLANGPVMTDNTKDLDPTAPYVTYANCGVGVMSGYYKFDYLNGNPSTDARYTFQFVYQNYDSSVQITVESGVESGNVITVNQPAGWYVELQNSAKLPGTAGIPSSLFIKP